MQYLTWYVTVSILSPPQAKNDAAAGNTVSAQQKGRIALILNIVSVVSYMIGVAIIIGSSVSNVTYSYCTYSYVYGYCYYY